MSEFSYINDLAKKCAETDHIEASLYTKYDVKRGLRDASGKGVLTGLTEISSVHGTKEEMGSKEYCDGELRYRGIDIKDLVGGFVAENRFGFEETIYLLLIGHLPNAGELKVFSDLLASYRSLPDGFVRDIIMGAPTADLMNLLARCVLTLYSYDTNANDISLPNVMAQCLHLISVLPMITIYSYHSYNHFIGGHSLVINMPSRSKSMAENILIMLRRDKKYTELEARLLEVIIIGKVGGQREPVSVDNIKEFGMLRLMDSAKMKGLLNTVSMPNWYHCIDEALRKAGKTRADINYLDILHIKRSGHLGMLKDLGLTEDQTIYLENYGHVGQIDQILSLKLALEQGKVKDGDVAVMIAAGIGYTWAANVIQWG